MVKTVYKLFRKLIRVISDKTSYFYAKSGYCHYLMAVTNPLICAQGY